MWGFIVRKLGRLFKRHKKRKPAYCPKKPPEERKVVMR
jgi:hypothetical protein